MENIEKLIKEYSSKKLKEIVEQQSSSYSENFINYAKDELIKRAENFQYNAELEKEIAVMKDNNLKNLVEKEWNNFHLEYLELARKEYLKRGFINKASDETQKKVVEKRYPALRIIANIYFFFAWIIGIITVIISTEMYEPYEKNGLMIAIGVLVFGLTVVLGLLATSESIRIFIDIEENTRKINK